MPTDEKKKEVTELATKLMDLIGEDVYLLEVAKDVIYEGRCRECLRLIGNDSRCWNCYVSPGWG